MKHGDQVSTPKGLGIFFEHLNEGKTGLVVLQIPTDDKVWVPLVEPGRPVWECFPCDVFKIEDLSIDKTYEERQREAHEAQMRANAEHQARMQAQFRAFQEAQRRANEQGQEE